MTDGIWAGDQAVGTLLLEVESLDPPFGGPALAHGDLHIWHPVPVPAPAVGSSLNQRGRGRARAGDGGGAWRVTPW